MTFDVKFDKINPSFSTDFSIESQSFSTDCSVANPSFDSEFSNLDKSFDSDVSILNQSFDSDFGMIQEVEVGGVTDHRYLMNRDANNQHPISAITNLEAELDEKLENVPIMSNQDIENILKGFV